MKVSLYTRERGARKFTKVKPNASYPMGTTFVLRYNGRWETLPDNLTLSGARVAMLNRQITLEQGAVEEAPKPRAVPQSNVLTTDAAVNRYLDFIRIKSAATQTAYGLTLRQFLRHIGDKPLAEITKEDLGSYHLSLQQARFSDRTAHNRLVTVTTFLRHFGVKDVALRVKYTEKKVRALRPDELKTFFAATTLSEWLLFQFFLCSGARKQEAIHAEKSDVDFVDGVLTIQEKPGWRPKDCEVREIPLPTFLLDALRKRPDGLLFPSVKGKENKVMLRTLKDVVKRAGLPGTWTLHKFRKTYATLRSASGIDVRTIQARLGHSSISTTLIYLQGEEPRSAVSKGQVNKAFSAFA